MPSVLIGTSPHPIMRLRHVLSSLLQVFPHALEHFIRRHIVCTTKWLADTRVLSISKEKWGIPRSRVPHVIDCEFYGRNFVCPIQGMRLHIRPQAILHRSNGNLALSIRLRMMGG